MATQPEPVAGIAFVDSPSLVLPAAFPTLVSSGGTLSVIAAGSSTATPIGGGGSGITVSAGAGLSGIGTAGSPLAGVTASGSVPGIITSQQFNKLFGSLPLSRATDLTGGNQTVNPFTDHASLYVLQNGVVTGNAILTLATAGGFGPQTCTIVVLDTSAFTYTIKDVGGTAIFTHPAGSVPISYTAYNGVGTGWSANVGQFVIAGPY